MFELHQSCHECMYVYMYVCPMFKKKKSPLISSQDGHFALDICSPELRGISVHIMTPNINPVCLNFSLHASLTLS